ncbi:FAD-dependent oxidoreductase [Aurantiacibacter sp. D1-12]|uniref:FAD-dependent oxidoreductase n=1 Tax=Aurantiacibacter sp. D1-12 TaxID=2993658 RepID=UPI00237CC4C5|nr:NAD(P)/FAD-dependent oxidoreductase [Aurantiacibacter sp. D1-12]MDE1467834.1 NAD(P)/FAD-dependent oxidoreductase [Aurantiacibacter sp. D1-12]
MQKIDIAIAGCGIGGLSAALMLHGQGHRLTLFERFAEPKPVGSGLMIQPTGLSVLDSLGLAGQVFSLGAPVDALLGLNTEDEPVLEAAYADLSFPQAVGIGIHRSSLFDVLFEAVQKAGITVETGREVDRTELGSGGRTLHFADRPQSPAFDLVVDALGVGSTLVPPASATLPYGALWATVDWPSSGPFNPRLLEQRYRRADQMVGLLPVGQGKAAFFWSLKGEDFPAWRDAGMAAFHDQVCALWPALEPVMVQLTEPDQLAFARYSHRTSPAAIGDRLVHIGDSWHAASPQLGQGANMALLDARGLAVAIAQTDSLEDALKRYVALRSSHVRLYQALAWMFTPPFQSGSIWPALFRDLFMAPASRIPPGPRLKANLVAGLVGARLGELELEVPDYSALS